MWLHVFAPLLDIIGNYGGWKYSHLATFFVIFKKRLDGNPERVGVGVGVGVVWVALLDTRLQWCACSSGNAAVCSETGV